LSTGNSHAGPAAWGSLSTGLADKTTSIHPRSVLTVRCVQQLSADSPYRAAKADARRPSSDASTNEDPLSQPYARHLPLPHARIDDSRSAGAGLSSSAARVPVACVCSTLQDAAIQRWRLDECILQCNPLSTASTACRPAFPIPQAQKSNEDGILSRVPHHWQNRHGGPTVAQVSIHNRLRHCTCVYGLIHVHCTLCETDTSRTSQNRTGPRVPSSTGDVDFSLVVTSMDATQSGPRRNFFLLHNSLDGTCVHA
jgi:hypothetical protein